MFRSLFLLLLSFVSIRAAQAQEYIGEGPAPSATLAEGSAPRPHSAALRLVLDSRLVPPAGVDSSLTTAIPVHAPAGPAFASDSYWKPGAVVGVVLGAIAGFGFGYAMDNIINEGKMSVGEVTIGGTVVGAVGGGLLGAGIGSLIRR